MFQVFKKVVFLFAGLLVLICVVLAAVNLPDDDLRTGLREVLNRVESQDSAEAKANRQLIQTLPRQSDNKETPCVVGRCTLDLLQENPGLLVLLEEHKVALETYEKILDAQKTGIGSLNDDGTCGPDLPRLGSIHDFYLLKISALWAEKKYQEALTLMQKSNLYYSLALRAPVSKFGAVYQTAILLQTARLIQANLKTHPLPKSFSREDILKTFTPPPNELVMESSMDGEIYEGICRLKPLEEEAFFAKVLDGEGFPFVYGFIPAPLVYQPRATQNLLYDLIRRPTKSECRADDDCRKSLEKITDRSMIRYLKNPTGKSVVEVLAPRTDEDRQAAKIHENLAKLRSFSSGDPL